MAKPLSIHPQVDQGTQARRRGFRRRYFVSVIVPIKR